VNAAGGILLSIGAGQEERKTAYQVLNVEQMTKDRLLERAQKGGQAAMNITDGGGDRRLARLQAMQLSDQRSRGDTRSRRARDDSDEEEEQGKSESSDEEEEEAALRRRKAARAKALREEEEEELWGQGEEEEEEEDAEDSRRKGHAEVTICLLGNGFCFLACSKHKYM
jgi:hypothetical protein